MDFTTIITRLQEMYDYETAQPEEDRHGASMMHWATPSAPVSIDAGAIRMLIDYYTHQQYKAELEKDPRIKAMMTREEYLFRVKNSRT